MTKVLVIGLDGATLDLVAPWAADGTLPVFAGLMRAGCHGRLRSVPNTDTAPAWSTFATGLNPARHGLFNERGWSPDRRALRPVRGGDRIGATFWRLASDAGRRVAVVNVPFTFPAEAVNGFVLAGIDAPGVDAPGFAHPPGYVDALRRAIGRYRIDAEIHIAMKQGRPDDGLAASRAVAAGHTAALRHALAQAPWDLAVVVYSLPDEAQHFFWQAMATAGGPHRHAIRDAYRFVEDQIAELMAEAGGDTVTVVFSDHGFGPICATTELLADWLAEQGFLRHLAPGRHPPIKRITGSTYRLIRRHLGEAPKAALRRALPRLRDRVESDVHLGGVDWAATRAYAGTSPWDVWINTRGREPYGSVAPGPAYEAVRGDILAALAEWRDPASGRPRVRAAWPREAVYRGPLLGLAPDITIAYDPAAAPPAATLPGNASGFDGDHQPEGLLIVAGPGIAAGAGLDGARLEDIAPTVLQLLGVAVPADLDGRALREALR